MSTQVIIKATKARADREAGIHLSDGELSAPVPRAGLLLASGQGHVSPEHDLPPSTGTELTVTSAPKGHGFIF